MLRIKIINISFNINDRYRDTSSSLKKKGSLKSISCDEICELNNKFTNTLLTSKYWKE